MTDKLKPCPFCGVGLQIKGDRDYGVWFEHVEDSDNCPMHAFGDDGYPWDAGELIEAINKRVEIPTDTPADDPLFTLAVWQRAVAAGLTTEGYDDWKHNRGRQ